MVGLDSARFILVGLGEDKREGDFAFDQPRHEVDIDLLGLVSAIDEHEDVCQIIAVFEVVSHEIIEPVSFRFGSLGVAIAWQIYEAPALIDDKKIDEPRVAGLLRNPGECLFVTQHIEQRRLAHIGASDKSKLRQLGLGTVAVVSGAGGKAGGTNLHW